MVAPGTVGPRYAIPQGPATARPQMVPGTPHFYARHNMQRFSGANYPRYRYRRRGYSYYYGGWWYAYPWWAANGYYYGGDCDYWSNFCAAQWGYDSGTYYSCLSYYGCF